MLNQPYITTGIECFDENFGGWIPGDLAVIASRPSNGKTSLAINFAIAAAGEKKPTIYFTTDQNSSRITLRIMSASSGVRGRGIQAFMLTDSEWRQFALGLGKLVEFPLFVSDESNLKLDFIEERIRSASDSIGLIIIDPITFLEFNSGIIRTPEDIEALCIRLKNLASKLNIPIIITSQLSALNGERDWESPNSANTVEGDALLKHADIALFLHRPEIPEIYGLEYAPTSMGEIISSIGYLHAEIVKNRRGDMGACDLMFDPSSGQVTQFFPTLEQATGY